MCCDAEVHSVAVFKGKGDAENPKQSKCKKTRKMKKLHLGVPAYRLLLLEAIGVKDTPDPREAFAFFKVKYENGLMEPQSGTFGYSAPQGHALVITEIDWQYEFGTPGGNVTLRVFLTWPPLERGVERRVLETTALLGSTGGGGVSTAVITGIVVPHGVKITIDAIGSGATGKIQHVLLRGYLISTLVE